MDLGTLWILLYLIVLILILYWSLLFSSLHAIAFATVIYVAYYLVAYAGDGCREWQWLRGATVWDRLRPYQVCCANPSAFVKGERYVFFNADSVTGAAAAAASGSSRDSGSRNTQMTLWAFGLHGKELQWVKRAEIIACLPDRVFYVPYITDVLQWAGCVADKDAAVAWEHNSVVVDTFDALQEIVAQSAGAKVALFKHDPGARCTVVGVPFLHDADELVRQAALLLRVSLVDPYDSLV